MGLGLTSSLFDLIDLIAMGEGLSYLYDDKASWCAPNAHHSLIRLVLQLIDDRKDILYIQVIVYKILRRDPTVTVFTRQLKLQSSTSPTHFHPRIRAKGVVEGGTRGTVYKGARVL